MHIYAQCVLVYMHTCLSILVPFHYSFPSSGEQPQQRVLACQPEEPTVSCIAIFQNYCCYIKHVGIITNWLYIKSLGISYWYIKIPQCSYTGHGLAHFTFYVQKKWHFLVSVLGLPLASDKLLGAQKFMKLAYRMYIYSVESLSSSNRISKITKTTK